MGKLTILRVALPASLALITATGAWAAQENVPPRRGGPPEGAPPPCASIAKAEAGTLRPCAPIARAGADGPRPCPQIDHPEAGAAEAPIGDPGFGRGLLGRAWREAWDGQFARLATGRDLGRSRGMGGGGCAPRGDVARSGGLGMRGCGPCGQAWGDFDVTRFAADCPGDCGPECEHGGCRCRRAGVAGPCAQGRGDGMCERCADCGKDCGQGAVARRHARRGQDAPWQRHARQQSRWADGCRPDCLLIAMAADEEIGRAHV